MIVNSWYKRLSEYGKQLGITLFPYMLRHIFALEYLRNHGCARLTLPTWPRLKRRVLETSGHVSVLKKSDFQPATSQDLKIPAQEAGLPVLLVNDGRIVKENLRKINRDEFWLRGELGKYGAMNLKDVYLAGIDGSGQLFYSMATAT